MRRSSSLFGLIGLILLVFAGVAASLTGGQTPVDQIYIAVNGIAGLVAVIIYLTTGFDQLRESVGSRSTKHGASTLVGSIVFLAILVIVNVISVRNSKRFDLTEQQIYSLSSQAVQVVEGLDQPLEVTAFVEGGVHPGLEDLLRTFGYHSEQFRYSLIDPVQQPQTAEQYKIRAYNSVRVAYGDEATVIEQPSEETLTNAIIKVTRSTKKTVCFVEGHGETSIDSAEARGLSSLKTALENENYEIEKLLLASEESVPERCSVLAVVGAIKPYLDHEVAAIQAFLDGGGRGIFLLRPRASAELKPLLAEWGAQVEDKVVVDQVVRLFQGPALGLNPLARSYGSHEITRGFRQMTIFPMTREVTTTANTREGLRVVELVQTSESSWGEADTDSLFDRNEATLDPADTKGPVSVAVAANSENEDGAETRVVVFGSAQFADNRELEGTYFNRDLLLNAFAWLVGEADLVSIRPRAVRSSRVQFSPEQGTVIFYLSVLLIPQLLLLVGIAVWWRRE